MRYAADNGASILQCSWGFYAGTFNSDQEYLDKRRIEVEAFDYFIHKKRPGSPLNGGIIFLQPGTMPGFAGIPQHTLRWFA